MGPGSPVWTTPRWVSPDSVASHVSSAGPTLTVRSPPGTCCSDARLQPARLGRGAGRLRLAFQNQSPSWPPGRLALTGSLPVPLLSPPAPLPTRLTHHAAHRDSLGLLGTQAQGLCTGWQQLLPPLTASPIPPRHPLLQASAPSSGAFPGHPTKMSDAPLLPACLCPQRHHHPNAMYLLAPLRGQMLEGGTSCHRGRTLCPLCLGRGRPRTRAHGLLTECV